MLNRLRTKITAANGDDLFALTYRLLTEFGITYWRRYLVVVCLMAIMAACTAGAAYLAGTFVNKSYSDRDFEAVAAIAVTFMIIFIVKGLVTYGHTVILAQISNSITANVERRMFDKLIEQDLAFFQDRHSSEFTSRLAYAASAISGTLSTLVLVGGRDTLTIVGLGTVMFYRSPGAFIIALMTMPVGALIVRNLIKRVRQIATTQLSGTAGVLQSMQEALQGLRVVKSLNLEDEFRRRVQRDVEKVEGAANKLARVSNRAAPIMEALGGIALGLTMLYGCYQVLVLGAEAGTFASFIIAFLLAYEPVKRIARLNVDLTGTLVRVRTVFEILDLPDRVGDIANPRLCVTHGCIEFRNVESSYRAREPVLRGISFVVPPGTVTALVGPSGGGKSTIFNVLLRLFDIDAGFILIDNQNITNCSTSSLRNNIAYVGQDVFLFRGTIRENIAFGRLDASQEAIVAAAKAAYAHDFIMSFPSGYDTQVGEHGLQLSGGQRQRIAIARALVRQAPIILLDEPTAALDSESERYVRDAISGLSRGRTTIAIAHRLHTVAHANVIHVIENGTIVESGTHDQLLQEGKRYVDLYKLQIIESTTNPAQVNGPVL